jgi:transposase
VSQALTTMRCMDRASLEQLLGLGLSLAEIGRRFGLHESTVAYWVDKHGLTAVNQAKHAAKGPLGHAQLQTLVDNGLSIAEIADRVGRSKATVRHWLRRHGMRTRAQEGRVGEHSMQAAKALGKATVTRECRRHGLTEFWLEGRGYYRCKRCRSERVSRRRRKIKLLLMQEAGGCCALCGYDRCSAALHFHHLDPGSKEFHLSMQGVTRSLAAARAEMAKCVLLCANCHAEVEAGVSKILPGAIDTEVA